MTTRNWSELYTRIGPLSYQSSDSDCVPTTIINGLTVLFGERLNPKLHRLIWALAGDQDGMSGTGWVCCDTLSSLLDKWFSRAHQDGHGMKSLPYTSQIIEGDDVNLARDGALHLCLAGGGVACLATGASGRSLHATAGSRR